MALASQLESPVRLYTSDDVRVPMRLSTVLQKKIDQLSETVLHGQLKHEEYRDFTGQIYGLKFALEECRRITEELA